MSEIALSDGEKIFLEMWSCTYRESEKQRRFADARVSDEEHFEQVVATNKKR